MEKKDLSTIQVPRLASENKMTSSDAKEALMAMDPAGFEDFVFEWLRFIKYKDNNDITVFHMGGVGDHGVDVLVKDGEEIDFYQCKKYGRQLSISQINDVIIKCLWYAYRDFDKVPRLINLCAFEGVSPRAVKVLLDPTKHLKSLQEGAEQGLKNSGIRSYSKAELKSFKEKLGSFDISHFKNLSSTEIITDYFQSDISAFRFKNRRFDGRKKPSEVDTNDNPFYCQLLKGYSQKECGLSPEQISDELKKHRKYYFLALSLQETCKYYFGNDSDFLDVKTEILTVLMATMPSFSSWVEGVEKRVSDILGAASRVQLDSCYLNYELHAVTNSDRFGICNMLVDEGAFSWYEE